MELFQKKYWERKSLIKRRLPQHPVIKSFVLSKIKEIRRIIPIKKETTLLDVGCGNGFFSYYFDKICDTTAIDYSETMISLNPVAKKYVMLAEDLKFPNDSFDIVFCNALLHHIEDTGRVLEEMKRVSRKYVIISEPNIFNPVNLINSIINKHERGALRFSLKYLKNKVEKHDLKIIDAFSFGFIVPKRMPIFSLPLLNLFEKRSFWGLMNIIITKK